MGASTRHPDDKQQKFHFVDSNRVVCPNADETLFVPGALVEIIVRVGSYIVQKDPPYSGLHLRALRMTLLENTTVPEVPKMLNPFA
jgi:hypothetical protein